MVYVPAKQLVKHLKKSIMWPRMPLLYSRHFCERLLSQHFPVKQGAFARFRTAMKAILHGFFSPFVSLPSSPPSSSFATRGRIALEYSSNTLHTSCRGTCLRAWPVLSSSLGNKFQKQDTGLMYAVNCYYFRGLFSH